MSQRRRTPSLGRALSSWRMQRRAGPDRDTAAGDPEQPDAPVPPMAELGDGADGRAVDHGPMDISEAETGLVEAGPVGAVAAGQAGRGARRRERETPADQQPLFDLGAHFLPLTGGSVYGSRGVLTWALAEDWHVVLEARGVEHLVRRIPGGFLLLAEAAHAPRAMEELAAYLRENRAQGWKPRPRPRFANGWATALCTTLLLAFYSLTFMRLPGMTGLPQGPGAWERLGAANSADILAGQWWRLATALTLHADAAHVASNAVMGAIFMQPLTASLGLGPGLLFTLVAGIAGNALNALAHGPGHTSIGFSTAVFGAAGVVSALRAMEGVHVAWTTPVAAGLGLLALMGASGERTDLGAHFFGFLAGLGLGAMAGWLVNRLGPPSPAVRMACGIMAAALPVLAWAWALVG